MAEHRGRPKDTPKPVREQWIQEWYEYPSKPEIGCKYIWHYDITKSKFGPFKTEIIYPKGFKPEKYKPEKGKAYNKMPVVMVFKTSNRSNAKTKMKIWRNENIDYIATTNKLVGVPETAITLELGVGDSFIERWRVKYDL